MFLSRTYWCLQRTRCRAMWHRHSVSVTAFYCLYKHVYACYCVFVSQRWQRAKHEIKQMRTTQYRLRNIHSLLSANIERHNQVWISLIWVCDTLMSTDSTHYSGQHGAPILAVWKPRRSILSCFHPPQAKEFLIDSAGRLRQRMRRRSVRQVADLCWSGQPTHFT